MHNWSEHDFDWQGLDKAIRYISLNLKRWGRIPVRDYKEKFGCYDEKTRVLTNNGWKFFKEININKDLIATLNKNKELEYQKAYDYIEYDYKGKMYSINTRGVNLIVTLNHNLYISMADINGGFGNIGYKKFSYELQKYNLLFKKDKNFLKGAKWNGENINFFELPEYTNTWNCVPSKTDKICRKYTIKKQKINIKYWLQFLGWYVAEGCTSKNCQVSLNIHKNEIDKLKKILNGCKFKYSISYRDKYGAVLNIYNSALSVWLDKNCGKLAENKKVPEFIKNLSSELIILFLNCLYEGDGHKSKTALTLYTASEALSDDVLELLLKAGFCGKVKKRDRRLEPVKYIKNRPIKINFKEISIRWLKKIEHRSSNFHDTEKSINNKEKIINYEGKVYCVSVPNSIIYVEREGNPVWCGNSARIYCSLGWSCLLNITHPGYMHYRSYPKWLMTFDIYYLSKIIPYLNYIIIPYHTWLYRKIYNNAVKKYPHLKKEICCCADYRELLKGLY